MVTRIERLSWRETLQQAWMHRGPLACTLLTIALPLRIIAHLRTLLYRFGIFKIQRVEAKVIVVGNVIAGGAGKTPTVIAVVNHLKNCGVSVGVVSRGYGRRTQGTRAVEPSSDAAEVGDEPLLIRIATSTPVFVGESRYLACVALLKAHPHTSVIVCDDGLQHVRLWRDLEICVFDDRGVGNGWTLPAGPLREPWPKVSLSQAGQRADRFLVLHTGLAPSIHGFRAQRALAGNARRCDGTTISLTHIQKDSLESPVIALAGIAHPEAFFQMLRAKDIRIAKAVAYPDHYSFENLKEFELPPGEGSRLICTEKDAVKLWKVRPNAWAVPLELTPEPAFWQTFDECMSEIAR
jgi:tetraacyldisaccharide 4'-kinase